MTFREKLADWISGGALSRARRNQDVAIDRYTSLVDLRTANADRYITAMMEGLELQHALDTIIALDTPNAAPTVKKAVRIAKEARG